MMKTDISDVLSKLKSLSESTDLIIYQHNRENETVDKWFTAIKETAVAIINNTKSSGSSASECPEIPDLVSSIKGEQLQTKKNRVSSLLAIVKTNHSRLSHHHRARASLRKIILEKKKGNQWEISNSKCIDDQKREKESVTQIKGRVSRSSAKVSPRRSTLEIKTTENNKVDDSYSTPPQNREVLVPNSDDKTPVTRSKTRDINPLKKLKQLSPNKKYRTEELTPDVVQKKTNKILTTDAQTLKNGKKSVVSDQTCKIEADSNFTPQNETIILDSSDESGESKPRTRSKRKSSFQITQEKYKKTKNSSSESQTTKQTTNLHEDNVTGSQYSKKARLNKNAKNAVIQPKTSGVSSQPVTTGNEKRILREIQKKEEVVSENTKKLRTMRQKKIEESKKNRELKMEKAMQQRMKIESEKKERMKCRTLSKQENVQQKEHIVKKTAQRKVQTEEKTDSIKKITPTSTQKMNQSTALKSLQDEKAPSSTPKKAPPKPVRTPVKAKLSPINIKETEKRLLNQTFTNPSAEALSSSKDVFAKPSPMNSTYVAKAGDVSSTPTGKKTESKTLAKTPVSSLNKKNNSYAMTPADSSFVSYDVSEIKSDDSDEEESSNNKPIPSWATGVRLRNALLNQQYNPINITELFGNWFETPDLGEIMGVEKKHYIKRTSSAIWINSPNRSLLY